jgi:hypothetical protein
MQQLLSLLLRLSSFDDLAYIACIKLAARLYRRTQLSWKHAAVFGVLLFLVLLAVGTCVRWLNLVSGPVPSSLLDIATGLLAQLAVGGWFLGPRARTAPEHRLRSKAAPCWP